MSRPKTTAPYYSADERAQGLAFARAWRIRMKPYFDALYGSEPKRCDACGQRIGGR